MTELLVFREKVKTLYSRNEVFILPLVKFLFAFLVLNVINSRIGYMGRLDNMAIVLIVALLCSFLPVQAISLFAVMFSLLHMYALSLETLLVGGVVFLLMFILFLRFSTGESVVVILTAMLCLFKVPYVMPVAAGLLGTPASALSVCCGVVVYYLIITISGEATTIATMEEGAITAKLRLLVDGLLENKAMLVVVAAFAATVIIVYMIRRMPIAHAWTVAIIAGVMADLLILLVGDLIYDTNVSVVNAVLGAVLAAAVAKVLEFLRFCVDYSRVEKVQYEDDEYYYYVKAVPKMAVAAPTKTVKRINTTSRTPQSRRPVTTERTGGPHDRMPSRRPSVPGSGRDQLNGGRSMTINSHMTEEVVDDYEELF